MERVEGVLGFRGPCCFWRDLERLPRKIKGIRYCTNGFCRRGQESNWYGVFSYILFLIASVSSRADALNGIEFHGRDLEIRFDKGSSSSKKAVAAAAPEPVRSRSGFLLYLTLSSRRPNSVYRR